MKTFDRYIISELFTPFLIGVFGFILFMLTDTIFALVELIVNKGIPILIVVRLLIFKLPSIMVLTFPVSMLFATIVAIGRMARDNEITAFRTSGISFLRLTAPVIIIALFVSFATYVTNEKIVPFSNHIAQNILRQMIFSQPMPEVRENIFFHDNNNRYFYLRKVDIKTLTVDGLLIYEIGTQTPKVITAKKATWKNNEWQLTQGVLHKYDENGHLAYEADFKKMKIYVNENILTMTKQKTPDEMNSNELKTQIDMLSKSGLSTHALSVDWHFKYSIPATCLIFALIGIPLSLPSIKGGKSWGMALSIILIFIFYIFASVTRSLGRGGVLDPILSAWLPNLTFGILAIILLVREARK